MTEPGGCPTPMTIGIKQRIQNFKSGNLLGRSLLTMRRAIYSASVALRFNTDIQIRLTPPTVLSRLTYVKISSITHHAIWLRGSVFKQGKIFTPGSWDLNALKIIPGVNDPGSSFKTMYEMFVENKRVEDTSEYSELNDHIQNLGADQTFRIASTKELVRHLEGYRKIFEDIQINGYKTQIEQGRPTRNDEIWVCAGRHGELIYYGGGSHRLAIAKILGIDYVPVGMRHVHPIWARHCSNKYKPQNNAGVLESINNWLSNIDCRELINSNSE